MFRDKKKLKKYISNAILVIAVCVFCYSAYQLYSIWAEYKRGEDEYDELLNIAFDTNTEEPSQKPTEVMDLDALKQINSDVAGWIKFENIDISYPILHGTDNDYYLHHTFNKEKNTSASIFIDYLNAGDFSDRNTVIYGHNMKNKSMFGLLNNYSDEEYFKQNPGFYIYDFTGKYYYEIFSCYTASIDGDSYKIEFASDEDFQNYINRIKEYSNYPIDVNVGTGDKLVMLSTCTQSDDYRFVVHAVRRTAKQP